MFDKILIANRGEIACRVIRTARRLGIRTVAVYSDADVNALHVSMADEAYRIGSAPARESYLLGETILQVAQRCGVQAIHPGYGFLSENEKFAHDCQQAGIVFIGAPPDAIAAMGSKSAAKQRMEKAHVPLIPGYHGDDQSPTLLQAEADKMGYPVLLKATAGGGGKGMRQVWQASEFADALAAAKREALSSFNDDRILIEKYLTKPRHIEIQVFADTHGNTVYLFERDCSIQRRHQKILEEAPAPHFSAQLRAKMGQAAVAVAQAIKYVGAGTVEFLVDEDGSFYFMEMNTRLQVEHPITEMITGLDLVEWQLLVAMGQALPCQQAELTLTGHAIEARIYAEDPANHFLPTTGRLKHLRTPLENAHIRIDTGVREGDTVSVYYDPMLAKLIVWDSDRAGALRHLRAALADYHIVGLTSNIPFLANLTAHPAYLQGDLDTGFIPRYQADLFPSALPVTDTVLALACLAVLLENNQIAQTQARCSTDPYSPWHLTNGWRMNEENYHELHFKEAEQTLIIQVDFLTTGYRLHLPSGVVLMVQGEINDDGYLLANLNGNRMKAMVVRYASEITVMTHGNTHQLTLYDPALFDETQDDQAGSLVAPMTGKIIAVHVKQGDSVKRGTALMILEAMKMEYTIQAPYDGTVQQVKFNTGELVDDGVELLILDEVI
ncbi:acetyl/propionyl/methylcrotonyl-CoA carboxylase subunit alpha [Beggiatoa leptomitoformis]|uniref:Biotin carboxylase n=1 Tax=Beggiatoa leptomitoformis TaxID=288004 RepID=A0A2N9YER0_9GAMM|nr:acetyl/propionyl/methylcrotonyl-CoA carboxylase subunit alpha [Beggiatoa leptomitoformis]ALG68670.1 acetyl-CoA carboxylase biotin carboxylase subunit [Beggiatoa leptomitoformis]AUI68978.1 acetyl-CoA carboxylase biotin carboxylase subunit [Beggiatoa leptomitoformis]